MQKRIREILDKSTKLSYKMLHDPNIHKSIGAIAKDIIKCAMAGGKVIAFGDGGSAADSQHLACELVGRFKKERRPIAAVALTTNTSTLTAIANDYDFKDVFSRQVLALVKKTDIVIGISTSGNSLNVLNGIKAANKLKAKTVGLLGKDGGKLKRFCKHVVRIPSSDTPYVQEGHLKIIHIIAELVEDQICK